MARTDTLGHFLTDVADAIRTKIGSSDTIAAEDFDTEIENIPSGGTVVQEKDVNFYDYDGTITNSYTKQEFLALETLPANPTHNGLIAQGWNWTLTDAKTYVQENGTLEIGQNYNTVDDALLIHIDLSDGMLSPYLGLGVNGTLTIDWGDNSETDTLTGDSYDTTYFIKHDYTQGGKYIIKVISSTNIKINGDNNRGSFLLSANNNTGNNLDNNRYNNCVVEINFGTHCFISNYGLSRMNNLLYISLPTYAASVFTGWGMYNSISIRHITTNGSNLNVSSNALSNCTNLITISFSTNNQYIPTKFFQNCKKLRRVSSTAISIGDSAFSGCNNLRYISIPNANSINAYAFSGCYSLATVTLPNVTSIDNQGFMYCYGLKSITLPKIRSISTYAFGYNINMEYYDFSEVTAIPTLSNINAFTSIPSDCKIIVPDSLYEDWIVANNWSDSSIVDHIIKKSDWDNL